MNVHINIDTLTMVLNEHRATKNIGTLGLPEREDSNIYKTCNT